MPLGQGGPLQPGPVGPRRPPAEPGAGQPAPIREGPDPAAEGARTGQARASQGSRLTDVSFLSQSIVVHLSAVYLILNLEIFGGFRSLISQTNSFRSFPSYCTTEFKPEGCNCIGGSYFPICDQFHPPFSSPTSD